MPERGLILGLAGHIDHGKTALVEALTGQETDRLPEERDRGISIELGFAELRLDHERRLGVIDVPGHERLVRTMVAGASGIDLFLMVVAADDGVMPQTREHWTVLRTLGVRWGVIALSKCDLAGAEARRAARAAALELMAGHPLVEVSARSQDGLAKLRAALLDEAVALERERSGARAIEPAPAWPEPAILHVDRVFSVHGAGTVVTGTLRSGEIVRGERVEIQPQGLRARVRTIHTHNREVERIGAGRRAALNLAGVGRGELARGDAIASIDAGLASTFRLDCELSPGPSWDELSGDRLQVHHGTRDAAARLVALDSAGLAQLRLEAPLIGRAGERVIVRRVAPAATLGGGVIVDAHPRRHGPRRGSELVRVIRERGPEVVLRTSLAELGEGLPRSPMDWGAIPVLGAARTRFAPARWVEAIERLVADGEAQVRGIRVVRPDRARRAGSSGSSVRVAASPGELATAALMLLREDGRRPRAPNDLARALGRTRPEVIAALEELVRARAAVRIRPDVYYDHDVLDALEQAVLELARSRGSISLAELRDELLGSRKYAQALLEHLGGEHWLIRRGDRHFPRREAAVPRRSR